ncbi:hypothetical protein ACS0TY_013185 [Phlomoides rotata]
MALFCQEKQLNPSRRCKLLASILIDTFSKCHIFPGKHPVSSPEAEDPAMDFDEDEVCVSAIISKYMESKCKKRALSPESGILVVTPKAMHIREEFYSTRSRLSRCSSATSFDAFVSVKTRFSRSSSLNKIDFQDLSKKSVVEFLQCEGWPFGLCKRGLLLPPLPKSPPDSWSWRNSDRMVKTHG